MARMELRRIVVIAALLLAALRRTSARHGIAPRATRLRDTEGHAARQSAAVDPEGPSGPERLPAAASGVDALLARIALAEQRSARSTRSTTSGTTTSPGAISRTPCCARPIAACACASSSTTSGAKANDEILLALGRPPRVEIRLFNPVASRTFRNLGMLGDFSRTNRRMHNKAFIADNQAAILGGRNIGDEYFEAGEVAFSDLGRAHLRPGVAEVSAAFDQFWNCAAVVPDRGALGRKGEAPQGSTACARRLAAFVEEQRDSPT
jgi:putative cardiolipin synthase